MNDKRCTMFYVYRGLTTSYTVHDNKNTKEQGNKNRSRYNSLTMATGKTMNYGK